tara:strand:+ start:1021 stop:1581 length:561 start_codon:yes stop_codon:yes gene_type:complete
MNETIINEIITNNETIVNDRTIVNDEIIMNDETVMNDETIVNNENINEQNITKTNLTRKNSNRLLGRIKWFSSRLGYGFVTTIDNNISYDYFIHWKNILYNNNNIYIFLFKNELVEFELKNFGYGLQAVNVTGPHKSPILVCTLGKSSKYLNNINKYAKKYKVHQLDINEFKSIENLSPETINLFE